MTNRLASYLRHLDIKSFSVPSHKKFSFFFACPFRHQHQILILIKPVSKILTEKLNFRTKNIILHMHEWYFFKDFSRKKCWFVLQVLVWTKTQSHFYIFFFLLLPITCATSFFYLSFFFVCLNISNKCATNRT